MSFMNYIEKACEEIDAAMFSGDFFMDSKECDKLKEYMKKWERQMGELSKIESEDNLA